MRKFAQISVDDLREKITSKFKDNPIDNYLDGYLLKELLGKDMKVDFDFENFEDGQNETNFGPQNMIGYHTLPNGLTYCGMSAGGDWEHPVFFIVYWDGKRLRAYIPTDGNLWNTSTKSAYGNDEESDEKNLRKRFVVSTIDSVNWDYTAMQRDIQEHFITKGVTQ